MTGEDLLKSLETVYILPDSSLTFVTARQLSPEVLRYAMDELEKMFPTQKVHLITAVHTVLVTHKPIIEVEGAPEAFFDERDKAAGYNEPVHVVDKESACGCISPLGY